MAERVKWEDLLAERDAYLDEYKNSEIKDNMFNYVMDLRDMESNIMKEIPPCEYESGIKYKFSSMNIANIHTLLQQEFYNIDVVENFKCYFNSLIKRGGDAINAYIPKMKVITRASQEGITYFGEIGEDLVLVKTPKIPQYADSLIHEALVGLKYLNELRQYIPNFMYIYHITDCSIPALDMENNVLSYCYGTYEKRMANRIMYAEAIHKSSLLKDLLVNKTIGNKELLEIYMQIFYALEYAHGLCKFNHGDLHSQNILVRVLDRPVYVDSGIGDFYMLTKYIPVIIDYGLCSFEHKGKRLFRYEYSQYYDISKDYPARDIYKLLLSTLSRSGDNTEFIKDILGEILDVDITTLDRKMFTDIYVEFPYVKSLSNMKYSDIRAILTKRAGILTLVKYGLPRYDHPIYICNESIKCRSISDIARAIGSYETKPPSSFYELNDRLLSGENIKVDRQMIDRLIETDQVIETVSMVRNKLFEGGLFEILDFKTPEFDYYLSDIISTLNKLVKLSILADIFESIEKKLHVTIYTKMLLDELDGRFLDEFVSISREAIMPSVSKIHHDDDYHNYIRSISRSDPNRGYILQSSIRSIDELIIRLVNY